MSYGAHRACPSGWLGRAGEVALTQAIGSFERLAAADYRTRLATATWPAELP